MSAYRFHGRERTTAELDGWFEPQQLHVPHQVVLDRDEAGRGRVQLFCFAVEDLRMTGVPLVRASYAEILWRIAVRAGGEPAWWVIACDLEALGPRLLASRYVRYPVRRSRVAVTAEEVRAATGDGELAITLGDPSGEERDAEQRILLVGDDAGWSVPWGDAERSGRAVRVTVTADSLARATLGSPVTWAQTALVRSGREHRCGIAQRRG